MFFSSIHSWCTIFWVWNSNIAALKQLILYENLKNALARMILIFSDLIEE